MTIFDYFRVLRRLAAAPRAPAARHSRANTLPIRFECLESRCLLSLAPPVATFIDADDLQVSKSSDTALVSRVSSNADGEAYIPIAGQLNSPTSPAYSLRPTWPDSANYWPGLPTGGQYSGRPLPGTQASPPMSGDLPGSPPLGGLIEIGPKQSQFTPMAAPEPSFSSKEAHDVLDMLSTLKYVPVPHRADDS